MNTLYLIRFFYSNVTYMFDSLTSSSLAVSSNILVPGAVSSVIYNGHSVIYIQYMLYGEII